MAKVDSIGFVVRGCRQASGCARHGRDLFDGPVSIICPKCSAAICQRGGRHYILGEKLRGKSKEASAALSRQGRYHTVAGKLRVKEVIIDDGTMSDRFVVCHNPEEAARDKQIREQLLTQLTKAIADSDQLPEAQRQKPLGGSASFPPNAA